MIVRRTAMTAAGLIALIALGCTPPNSARGVVDRFIEAHYMAIDLKAAEPLCTSLALDKLQKEIALTQGQEIDASTRKPIIHYKLVAQRGAGDHITFLFVATVEVPEAGSFQKNWMIAARKEGTDWKISNFNEYD